MVGRRARYVCEGCGAPFKPVNGSQRFCGSKKTPLSCSWRHSLAHRKAKNAKYYAANVREWRDGGRYHCSKYRVGVVK